ncbi:MAG: trypsin-like peptidase domain-containing protein [Bacteroidales bacterium]|nr:trypsin-like peptidase domain-containing protein [Bacteroidales bacterium]
MPPVGAWHDITVDPLQVEIMRSIEQAKDQPYQFAIPVQVSLTPENAGFIVTRGNETIWVMPVSSKGALSLNLILSPFNLPEGAYIYVYDQGNKVVRGAYTRESGTNTLTMPLLPVPGEKIVLECHFPGRSIPRGSIGVKQVAHDFAGFFGLEGIKDLYFGRSGDCEVDINCSTNPNYLRAARSVVRLLVAGSELCTGVLVNNTGSEYKAYVLTANHCIDTATQAANTIFVFNYQSPWCDGPDLTNMHSLAGSLLRAENPDIDFTLVELNQFPSLVYRPYFAGWDITPTVPSNTYTLHHPEGDVMKISIDDNAPISTSYPLPGYVSNSFWRVLRWEMGATEPGSSGGPLFDSNGRLRGTLTGGGATCIEPINDYYAKLSRMFNITSITSSSLKPWLDPMATGSTIAGGRDPYEDNLSRADTLRNMPASDPGTTDSYFSPGWGYSTGHNSDSLTRFAEYITFNGTGEIAWVKLSIAAATYLAEADSIRVFLWNGGAQPGSVIASKMYRIREVKSNFEMEVDFGRTIKVTGSYYVGYTVYYKGKLSQPQSRFAVKHSVPWPLSTQNTAWFHNGTTWRPFTEHPSFPMSTSLGINVIMVENSVLNGIENPDPEVAPLMVFPNPFTSSLSFSITGTGVTETTLRLYDNTGRVVNAGEYRNIFPGVLTLELPWLAPGIYHYGLKTDSVVYTGTIIKTDTR